jgi:hypothetical protein
LVADGTPLPVGRSGAGALCFFFFLGLAGRLCLDFCLPPCEDCCSPVLVPAGSGVLEVLVVVVLDDDEDEPEGFGGEVEVEVEVEPAEVGVVEDVEDVGGAEVVVVVVLVVTPADGVVEVDGAHDSLSEATGPGIGRPIAEMGVPGATLTWKTKVWPLTRVTVTVHASADAVGTEAMAMATNIAPASTSTVSSFRRPIMAAPLRPSSWCALHSNNGRNPR